MQIYPDFTRGNQVNRVFAALSAKKCVNLHKKCTKLRHSSVRDLYTSRESALQTSTPRPGVKTLAYAKLQTRKLGRGKHTKTKELKAAYFEQKFILHPQPHIPH